MKLTTLKLTTLLIIISITCAYSQNFTANEPLNKKESVDLFVKNGHYVDASGNPFSGKLPEYNDIGNKLAEYTYINGMKHGEVAKYYPNGILKEIGYYQYNKKHGSWKAWGLDGNMLATGKYKNNLRDGYWYIYFPNGQKHMQKHYKSGKKIGHWIWWDKNGKVTKNSLF